MIMIMIMVDRNQFMIMTEGSNHDHRGQIGFLLSVLCFPKCVLFCFKFDQIFSPSQLFWFPTNLLETPSSILLFNPQFRFRLSAITTFPVCHHSQAGKMTWECLLNLIITNKAITKTQISKKIHKQLEWPLKPPDLITTRPISTMHHSKYLQPPVHRVQG